MPRWNKRELAYKFRSSAYVISNRQLRPIISRAFGKWIDASNFTSQEAWIFNPSGIVVGYHYVVAIDDTELKRVYIKYLKT